jgi:ketosteroid isomerase-like protein
MTDFHKINEVKCFVEYLLIKIMVKKNFYVIVICILISGCQKTVSHQDQKSTLLKVDSAFSALSESKGMKEAFDQYLDDKGVMFRTNSMPIIGKENIARYHIQIHSNYAKLSWKPSYADISISDDVGYTYGLYQFKSPDTLIYGSYVTIWKKNALGMWKVVVDNENAGIGK